MKLSKEQIERLYKFTRQHYVEYYDLQTELVDHLANSIEEQWQQNPKLSFEDALQIEFKKFGVFGFLDVVEKRQIALNKKYNKIVWSHFKDFFTLPKIIGTIITNVVVFFIVKNSFNKFDILFFSFLIVLFSLFFSIIYLKHMNKKKNKLTGKKWLFKDIIYNCASLTGMAYLPIQIIIHSKVIVNTNIGLFITCFFIVSMALIEYIIIVEIPSKAEEYLKETYPEYGFVE